MDLGLDGNTHFPLVVSDPAKSSDWYGRVFGFREIRDVTAPDIHIDGECDACTAGYDFKILFHVDARIFLGLSRLRNRAPAGYSPHACGLQHFGLHVRERDNLDGWVARLDSLGIAHSAVCREGPGWLVRFRDPDGIPVEVYWTDMTLARQMFVETARNGAETSARR